MGATPDRRSGFSSDLISVKSRFSQKVGVEYLGHTRLTTDTCGNGGTLRAVINAPLVATVHVSRQNLDSQHWYIDLV